MQPPYSRQKQTPTEFDYWRDNIPVKTDGGIWYSTSSAAQCVDGVPGRGGRQGARWAGRGPLAGLRAGGLLPRAGPHQPAPAPARTGNSVHRHQHQLQRQLGTSSHRPPARTGTSSRRQLAPAPAPAPAPLRPPSSAPALSRSAASYAKARLWQRGDVPQLWQFTSSPARVCPTLRYLILPAMLRRSASASRACPRWRAWTPPRCASLPPFPPRVQRGLEGSGPQKIWLAPGGGVPATEHRLLLFIACFAPPYSCAFFAITPPAPLRAAHSSPTERKKEKKRRTQAHCPPSCAQGDEGGGQADMLETGASQAPPLLPSP